MTFCAGQTVRLVSMQEVLQAAYDKAPRKLFIEIPPISVGSIGVVTTATVSDLLTEVKFEKVVLWCSASMLELVELAKLELKMFPVESHYTSIPWAGTTMSMKFKGLVDVGKCQVSELSIDMPRESDFARKLEGATRARKTYRLTLEETGETF